MKKTILYSMFLVFTIWMNSCGPKENPPLVFFPDMYYSVAYEPLSKAEDAYSNHQNKIPVFIKQNGSTALSPVEGSVPRDKDNLLPYELIPKTTEEYNTMYEKSKSVTQSPLNPDNKEKDIERGKILYNIMCATCHGEEGDGQGSIVKTGAYAGVPAYKDREISIGSVHYVIVNGRNAMGSFASQLSPADRWRVSMYVMEQFKGENNKSGIK